MQPLLGEPNPPTTGPAAARDADLPLWIRKHLNMQSWGVESKIPARSLASPCAPVAMGYVHLQKQRVKLSKTLMRMVEEGQAHDLSALSPLRV